MSSFGAVKSSSQLELEAKHTELQLSIHSHRGRKGSGGPCPLVTIATIVTIDSQFTLGNSQWSWRFLERRYLPPLCLVYKLRAPRYMQTQLS